MAKSLNMQVVAEGVETSAQLSYLEDREVDFMQGYYFSAAVTADAFLRMVRHHDADAPPLRALGNKDR